MDTDHTCRGCGQPKTIDESIGETPNTLCKECKTLRRAEGRKRSVPAPVVPEEDTREPVPVIRPRHDRTGGLSKEEFKQIWVDQDEKCACCGKKVKAKEAALDGEKGICGSCQKLLVPLREDPKLVKALRDYLSL